MFMDGNSQETKNTVGASPIPDLFNTEPETPVETTTEKGSEGVVEDTPVSDSENKEAGTCCDSDEIITNNGEPTKEESIASSEILNGISLLSEQVQSLEKLFSTKIMHSEHEKKIVDQMHRELQKYKDDMYAQLIRPIILDVINMRDSILKQLKDHKNKPDGEQHIPLQMFETYAFDTDEILEKNNIEIYRSDKNSDFESARQKAIKKITTDEQSLHGKIAESIADGYIYQGKTLSPEKVTVYVYEPKHEQELTK
jgi:molecular chaperone GrpE (heat shock protein)